MLEIYACKLIICRHLTTAEEDESLVCCSILNATWTCFLSVLFAVCATTDKDDVKDEAEAEADDDDDDDDAGVADV